MNRFVLKRNALEAFDKANPYCGRLPDPDIIGNDLDNLDNDFEALFPTPPFPVHDVDWGRTKDRAEDIYMDPPHVLHENIFNDSMSISDNVSIEDTMQGIARADSAKIINTSFNTSFDTESLADFFAMSSSSPLPSEPLSKACGSMFIKDNTTLPCKNLALVQKWEIVRHVRSRKTHWILREVVTSICWIIKNKLDIIPKPWQVNVIVDTIYDKKNVVISASTGSGKSLPYQLIPLIKEGAIVLVVFPTITLMNDQVCWFVSQ